MIEIILMLILLVGAAKRKGSGRKRSMGAYLKGSIDESIDLGTLAANTLVAGDNSQVTTERTLVSSIKCTWAIDGMVAGQGPIVFGVAHSDYTDAEIEAVIENTGSWNAGDKVQSREIAKRLVRQIGIIVGVANSGTVDSRWNQGRPMKTKLNWVLNTGQTIQYWAYNASDAALSTAVPDLLVNGHANLWLK